MSDGDDINGDHAMVVKRGRVSAADGALVIEGSFGTRPEPPEELNEEQAEIWRSITASEHADFFATAATKAMLKDLCRRRHTAEMLSKKIDQFQNDWLTVDGGVDVLQNLLKMRNLEMTAATHLATKLRLTNQSRYNYKTAQTATKNTLKGSKPWEA